MAAIQNVSVIGTAISIFIVICCLAEGLYISGNFPGDIETVSLSRPVQLQNLTDTTGRLQPPASGRHESCSHVAGQIKQDDAQLWTGAMHAISNATR